MLVSNSLRSCRERLAAHKDRQRRKWQASHGRRGSDSASSGEEDEDQEAQEGSQPTTVTRAGRPSRRPSLLHVSTGISDSGIGTSPEWPGSLKRVSPTSAMASAGAPPRSVPSGGSLHVSGVARGSSGSLVGLGGGAAEQQQQQPPTAFQQALAMSRAHSDALPNKGWQDTARARRSASMSQMQVQWLRLYRPMPASPVVVGSEPA